MFAFRSTLRLMTKAADLPPALLALPADFFSASSAKKVVKVAAPAASKPVAKVAAADAAAVPKTVAKATPPKTTSKAAKKAPKVAAPKPAAAPSKSEKVAASPKVKKVVRKFATRKPKSAAGRGPQKSSLDDFFNGELAKKIVSILKNSGEKKDAEISVRIAEVAKKLQQAEAVA